MTDHDELAPGTRVVIRNLTCRPKLNGYQGSVIRYHPDRNRYGVALDGQYKNLLVRRDCLDTEEAARRGEAQRKALKAEADIVESTTLPSADKMAEKLLSNYTMDDDLRELLQDHAANNCSYSDLMRKVLARVQKERGLPVEAYGDTPEERLRFRNDYHNMAGIRPDFASCGL